MFRQLLLLLLLTMPQGVLQWLWQLQLGLLLLPVTVRGPVGGSSRPEQEEVTQGLCVTHGTFPFISHHSTHFHRIWAQHVHSLQHSKTLLQLAAVHFLPGLGVGCWRKDGMTPDTHQATGIKSPWLSCRSETTSHSAWLGLLPVTRCITTRKEKSSHHMQNDLHHLQNCASQHSAGSRWSTAHRRTLESSAVLSTAAPCAAVAGSASHSPPVPPAGLGCCRLE
jgi:hypothetical protein